MNMFCLIPIIVLWVRLMAKKFTTIGVTNETKMILAKMISYKGESYESIILRIIKDSQRGKRL